MRKAGAFATFFFVMLTDLPALASGSLDGNGLLPKCEAEVKTDGLTAKDYQAAAYCQGLVRGVVGMSLDINIPEDATLDQGCRVVLLYLQNHPEELHKSDYFLVHEALRKAFPAK